MNPKDKIAITLEMTPDKAASILYESILYEEDERFSLVQTKNRVACRMFWGREIPPFFIVCS